MKAKLISVFLLLCSDSVLGTEEYLSFGAISKGVRECMKKNDKLDCMQRKMIDNLEKEAKSNNTVQIDGLISIKKDPDWTDQNETILQRSLDETKGGDLSLLVIKKLGDYVKSRVIELKMNQKTNEARKTDGKNDQMLVYGALGVAGILSQMFIGKMALISGMALFISKLSLVLALAAAFKKMSSAESWAYHPESYGAWSRTTRSYIPDSSIKY